ncbi:MAG: pantoate--beta-alanine ligase [Gammaproteobacteria bacterium]|nr:pantoate--beta-alanine ligase [Gammaproteobacteria bacterium]
MQTVKTRSQTKSTVQRWKQAGESVAFVPTMGNLHEGHLKLVDTARQHADKVVVSIFVNPAQFGKNEDIDSYPRELELDSKKLAERGVDLLFAPETNEIYADDTSQATWVEVPKLSSILCGEFRPVHFVGVTTIVAKLFNIVQPDVAIFGEKDFQQLFLIRKMVNDLDFPVKIIGMPTEREADGLAMSSRNSYLSAQERKQAPLLYQALNQLASEIKTSSDDYRKSEENAAKFIENAGFMVDYVSIRRVSDLQPASHQDHEIVILAAARLGKTRLIDNIAINI